MFSMTKLIGDTSSWRLVVIFERWPSCTLFGHIYNYLCSARGKGDIDEDRVAVIRKSCRAVFMFTVVSRRLVTVSVPSAGRPPVSDV